MSSLIRFLGDTPLRVAVKLVVVSFLVGVLMSAFGLYPRDVLRAVGDFLAGVWNMGFDAVYHFGSYMLLGAAIVVPAFFIIRLLAYRR